MSFSKLKERLDNLLAKLENISEESENTPYTEEVFSFIKWRQVADLTKIISNTPKVPTSMKFSTQKAWLGYKDVAPKILKYKEKLKNVGIKSSLDYFTAAIFKSLDLAEKNLKVLPKRSYEIYEDTLKFIDLFDKTLDPPLISTAKKLVKKKISILKQAFEVEAGRQNLEEEQKALTENLQKRLEGIPVKNENKIQDPIETPSQTESNSVSLSGLILPEEEIQEDLIADEYRNEDVINRDSTAVIHAAAQEELSEKLESYPYWMWYPSQTINNFMKLRYCTHCGKKIDENYYCRSCNNYINHAT